MHHLRNEKMMTSNADHTILNSKCMYGYFIIVLIQDGELKNCDILGVQVQSLLYKRMYNGFIFVFTSYFKKSYTRNYVESRKREIYTA